MVSAANGTKLQSGLQISLMAKGPGNGKGTRNTMDLVRQSRFKDALKPNLFEWDAVMTEQTSIYDWRACLPKDTTVLSCKHTIKPAKEIVNLFRRHMTSWKF